MSKLAILYTSEHSGTHSQLTTDYSQIDDHEINKDEKDSRYSFIGISCISPTEKENYCLVDRRFNDVN